MNLTEDSSGFIRRLFLQNMWHGVAAQIVSIAGPVVCTSIAGILYEKNGLAVIVLFSPFFFLAGFFGTIIANGSATIAAAYMAKDDSERVAEIYALAVFFSVLIATLLWLAMILLKEPIISLLSGDGELYEMASRYYVPTAWYTFFTVLVYMPIAWARLMGRPVIPLILTLTMSGAGAALGALYTFVLGMGLESLAAAQAQATAAALAIALVLIHRPQTSRLTLKRPRHIRKDGRAMILAGSPLGLSRLYRFANTMILNAILMRWVGTAAIAVLGILNVFQRLFTAISNGIVGAQMPIASVLREERDGASLRQLARSTFGHGNAITLVTVLSIIIFRTDIAFFFGADPDVLVPALLCFVTYVPFYVNIQLYVAWLTSLRFIVHANTLAFAHDMFLPLLSALLFVLAGVWIWLHMPLTGAASALLWLILVGNTRRRHKELSYPFLTGSQSNDVTLSFSVACDGNKASEASEAVNHFCEARGLDGRRSMLIALAIEEIIVLMAERGTDGGKQRDVSVRMTILDDDVVLRLRTGGRKFNPLQYYQERIKTNENPTDNADLLGIKFIIDASKKLYYKETFGVNNTVIVI